MKLIVLSDTHGRLDAAEQVLEDFEGEIDGFIHLGDHIDDAIRLRRMFPKLKFWAVKGNCDFTAKPSSVVTTIMGHRLYLCHGHIEGARYDNLRVLYAALENNCEAALYGHTHCPEAEEEEGIKIYNPGSITLPRQGTTKTFGILELEKNSISMEIYGIFKNKYKLIMRG